jgi:hypothetical protein
LQNVETTPGPQGPAGVGVSSVTEYYLATSASSGITTATAGWTTTMQALTATNKYLWSYKKTTYTDSSTINTAPVIIGVYGDQGVQGPDGTTTYTWVKYADDMYGGNMSDTTSGKRYIGLAFNKTTAVESSNASDYQWSPLYDNVSVGVRNLAIGTSSQYWTNWGSATVSTSEGMRAEYVKAVRTTTTGSFGVQQNTPYRIMKLVAGEEYTLSFKVRGTIGLPLNYVYIMNESGGNQSINGNTPPSIISDTDFQQVSMTFTKSIASPNSWVMVSSNIAGAVDDWLEITEVKVENGNIYTDWSLAPEDLDAQLAYKASTADVEALATIVSTVSADLNNKAGMGEFQALQEAYNARVAQDIIDKDAVAASLATIEGRTTLVETIAGNNKIVTDFINTVITESEEGIYIANGASSTGILISSNRISFMDNNVEVAYISNQTMQINHGIFVQSATISDFKFEKIPGTTILAVQWVGD